MQFFSLDIQDMTAAARSITKEQEEKIFGPGNPNPGIGKPTFQKPTTIKTW